MKRVIATIHFLPSDQSTRTQSIPPNGYGCPAFFSDILALAESGWDCRLFAANREHAIELGETVSGVCMLFLRLRLFCRN